MRLVQITAVTLLILGAAAASFTIWQIVNATAAQPALQGPAPMLIGDAPPPATSTPEADATSAPEPTATARSSPSSAQAPATTAQIARNLGPADPMPEPQPPAEATATPQPLAAAGHSASRDQPAAPAVPAYLRIPYVDIDASIVPVGFNERGEMASPDDFDQIGWWQFGAVPGDYGRAVLAGHVDSPTGEAVFYGIDQLAPGNEIFVGSQEPGGPELRFVVTGAALYHIDHAPVDQIFGPSTERELILITCGGTFDHDAGEYLYRLVVFARLAE